MISRAAAIACGQTAWLLAGGCNGGVDQTPVTRPSTGGAAVAMLCIPGEQRACGCLDGASGVRICVADGQSFGPCACDGGTRGIGGASTATGGADRGAGGTATGGGGGATSGGGGVVGGGGALACAGSFADCDGDPADGCEVDTDSSLAHCGGCNTPCASTNGIPLCAGGECHVICTAGALDCNGVAADGCEIAPNDGANCGACGHDCEGGLCSGGSCGAVVLALNAFKIAVLGGWLYWANDEIHRMPVAGGADTVLTSCATPVFAVDASSLYFTHDIPYTVEQVQAMPLGGGPVIVLGSTPWPSWVAGVEGDADALYWADGGSVSHIWRSALNGDPPITLATETVSRMALAPTHVYWTSSGGLRRVPKAGGAVESLDSDPNSPLAIDATHVYFVKSDMISRLPLAGGAVEDLTLSAMVMALRREGSWLYWLQSANSSQILRVPASGGAAAALVTSAGLMYEIAVEGSRLFYIMDGTLYKQVQ